MTEQLCPHNYTAADACSLPVCAGHYGRDYAHPYTATLPDIPLELDWLLEGVFHLQVALDMHAGNTMQLNKPCDLQRTHNCRPDSIE